MSNNSNAKQMAFFIRLISLRIYKPFVFLSHSGLPRQSPPVGAHTGYHSHCIIASHFPPPPNKIFLKRNFFFCRQPDRGQRPFPPKTLRIPQLPAAQRQVILRQSHPGPSPDPTFQPISTPSALYPQKNCAPPTGFFSFVLFQFRFSPSLEKCFTRRKLPR